jgi:signal transduction histidine kinase
MENSPPAGNPQLQRETEAGQALARLVPGLAHDLNTLIGIALTAATHASGTIATLDQSLDGATLTKARLQSGFDSIIEALRLVEGNLNRAAQLIGGLKHLTGQAQGAAPAVIDVRALLEDLELALGPNIRKSPHRLEIAAPAVLPLRTRGVELGRVLLNLIQNSLTHAFPSGQAGTVRLAASQIEGGVTIAVADDGDGMSPEVAAHAFDPYFTTRRDEGGTGLGLAVAKDLVQGALEGQIDLETAPGKGTTIRLTLLDLEG